MPTTSTHAIATAAITPVDQRLFCGVAASAMGAGGTPFSAPVSFAAVISGATTVWSAAASPSFSPMTSSTLVTASQVRRYASASVMPCAR